MPTRNLLSQKKKKWKKLQKEKKRGGRESAPTGEVKTSLLGWGDQKIDEKDIPQRGGRGSNTTMRTGVSEKIHHPKSLEKVSATGGVGQREEGRNRRNVPFYGKRRLRRGGGNSGGGKSTGEGVT